MAGEKYLLILCVVVILLTAAVHWPVLSCESFCFDDDQYLLENRLVQNPGLDSAWCFMREVLRPSTVRGYYQPLSMISLMLDYAFGGRSDNLLPFRITSLYLHLSNTVLVIVLLYILFGHGWSAALGGLVFGAHPLTVEAVAWLGERKTLIGAFFALWCLVLYLLYARRNKKGYYFGCLGCMVAAFMSKPTTVPLPFLMLVLDYWPLKRLCRKALYEKIPFFILAAGAAVITYLSQKNTAHVITPSQYGFEQIPLIVCHNIVFYLYKLLYPFNLSAYYPFPEPFRLGNPMVLAAVVGTCVLTAGLILSLRWTRGLLSGWGFFFVGVFPTLGIVGFHPEIAADRHVYLPMVGFLLPAVAIFSRPRWYSSKSRLKKILSAAVVLAVFCGEAAATRIYYTKWRDTVTLYKYMVSLTPDYPDLQNNLALALSELGQTPQAIEHYRRAVALKGNSPQVHTNLGNALVKVGLVEEAIEHFKKAISLCKSCSTEEWKSLGLAEAYYNLGRAHTKSGDYMAAIANYRAALGIKHEDADAFYGLARCFSLLGDNKQAIKYYRKALEVRPGFLLAHGRLAITLAEAGQAHKAMKHMRFVLKADPNDAQMHCNLGILLHRKGKYEQAKDEYMQTLELDPNHKDARRLLESLTAGQKPEK